MKKMKITKILIKITLSILCIFMTTACSKTKDDEENISNEIKNELSYPEKLFDDSYVHEIKISLSEEDYQDLLTRALEKNRYVGDVEIDGEIFNDVQISTKGSSTLFGVAINYLHNYSLKLRFKHDGNNNSYHGLDVLNLNNNMTDNSKLRDHIIYDIFNETDVASPLTSYTLVSVNGEELGVYLALEGLEKSFLKRNNLDDAELYKPEGTFYEEYVEYQASVMQEALDNGTFDEFLKENNTTFSLMEEFSKIYMAKHNLNDLSNLYAGSDLKYTDDNPDNYTDIFNGSVKNCSETDKEKVIKALKNLSELNVLEAIDTKEVIGFLAANNFVLNADGFNNKHNYYLLEDNGLLKMLSWDNNLAMYPSFSYLAEFDEQGIYDIGIDDVMSVLHDDDNPMWHWIKTDDKWLNEYHNAMDKLLKEYFESGKCEKEINRVNEMIRPYIEKYPNKLCTLEEYDKDVNIVSNFIKGRTNSIRKQLNGELPTSTSN